MELTPVQVNTIKQAVRLVENFDPKRTYSERDQTLLRFSDTVITLAKMTQTLWAERVSLVEEAYRYKTRYESLQDTIDLKIKPSEPVLDGDKLPINEEKVMDTQEEESAFDNLLADTETEPNDRGVIDGLVNSSQAPQQGAQPQSEDDQQPLLPIELGEEEVLVKDIGLSTRAFNCLDAEGVKTVSDLTKMTRRELLKVRGLGKGSFNEVVYVLNQLGLSLAQ